MDRSTSPHWVEHRAEVVRGHQVASGSNGDPRFPGGTVRMQVPHFLALGLDLGLLYPGTLNISIAPLCYRVVQPRFKFVKVKWHPTEPAETFSFFDIRLLRENESPVRGFIYHPHPETKPEHFQKSDVLEVLLPYVEGISVGSKLKIEIPSDQMVLEETQMSQG